MKLLRYFRKPGRKKIICIDFDGVIHSYISGFEGMGVISDPPVLCDNVTSLVTAIDWLRALLLNPDLDICIFSSRNKSLFGRRAMKRWLCLWGLSKQEVSCIGFPFVKSAVWCIVDDRCIKFNGTFPTGDELLNFETWQKSGL